MENSPLTQKKGYKILSALPVLGQPRDAKRIAMLQAAGFSVEVVTFQRNHHKGRIPDCPITLLGRINNGQYFRRIILMIFTIPLMRRAIRRNHLLYASGPDMALLAIIANVGLGRPIVFEVGDIRKIQVSSGALGTLVRLVDRVVAKFSKLLVVTAKDFVDGYYRKRLNIKTPAIVLENKLENQELDFEQNKSLSPVRIKPLKIGYFGVLRCDWSWKVLEKLALSEPNNIKIIIAGHILEPTDLIERAAKLLNVEFRGEYRSPQDLSSLYSDLDFVWACYPPPENKNKNKNKNWRWAQMICRSNRFYESCYFKKPIISVAGSGDAKEVERYGIGEVVSDQAIDSMITTLTKITQEKLLRWDESLSKLPKSVYEYTTEIDDLGNAIRKIINNNKIAIINE